MGVLQRGDTDCGVAAVATLVGLSYEDVRAAWVAALARGPGLSTFSDLRRVLLVLGYPALRVSRATAPEYIQRVRAKPGDQRSHWVVRSSGSQWLWCPAQGRSLCSEYGMRVPGHCLEIEVQRAVLREDRAEVG